MIIPASMLGVACKAAVEVKLKFPSWRAFWGLGNGVVMLSICCFMFLVFRHLIGLTRWWKVF